MKLIGLNICLPISLLTQVIERFNYVIRLRVRLTPQ